MRQIGTILFFNHFFSLLPNMSTHNLVIGGDINCALSPLDRSTLRRTTLTKSAQSIDLFLETCGVADVWRFRSPTSRAYSFFFPVHKTYSHIDYFFLAKRILHSIVEGDNEAIVISEYENYSFLTHSPSIAHGNLILYFSQRSEIIQNEILS